MSWDLGEVRTFFTDITSKACLFLLRHQLQDGGWPQFENGSITLHHTALGVSALSATNDPKFANQIARAVSHAQSEFRPKVKDLGMGDLAAFLFIVCSEQQLDSSLRDLITESLQEKLQSCLDRPTNFPVREVTNAIAALRMASAHSEPLVRECIQALLPLENASDLGWPANPKGSSSIIPTAYVVEALAGIDLDAYADSIGRATRFLETRLNPSDARQDTISRDLFARATALQALCSVRWYSIPDSMLTIFEASSNPEGGWGGTVGSPSSIEATAIVLKALITCGEIRFVSWRKANACLVAARRHVGLLESEVSKAQHGLEEQISRQSSKIIEERNALRKENQRLKAAFDDAQKEAQSAQRYALEVSTRSEETTRALFKMLDVNSPVSWITRLTQQYLPLTIGTVCIGWSLLAKLRAIQLDRTTILFLTTLSVVSIGAALFTAYDRQRNTRSLTSKLLRTAEQRESSSEVSQVVIAYYDATSDLHTAQREELAYFVAGTLLDSPADIGVRSLDSLLISLDLPRPGAALVRSWATEFLRLDVYSRRAVAEQIRRVALK